MKFTNEIAQACKEVYGNKRYFFITFGFAIVLFSTNALLRNYKLLLNNFSFSLLGLLIAGQGTTFTTGGLISLMVISVLAGVVLSMSVFLVMRQARSSVSAGGGSVLIAVLAPACPSCALGVLSIFGLGGLLAFLPFKGLEIGFLGVVLLILSISYLSKKITTQVCRIES